MNKKKKDENITFLTIWKWLRSEKGKRYSFIIFYIFFFIFLIIFMNIDFKSDNKNNNNNYEDTSRQSSLPFETSNLENNYYNFSYIITCPNKIIYQGNKNNNLYTFKNNSDEYKYELLNGNLKSTDDNIEYVNFTNIYFLRQIIKNSKLISETKLNETNEYIYTYKIKNNLLANYLNEENDSELETEILVNTDLNKKINNMKINLNNYKQRELCNIEFKLENNS